MITVTVTVVVCVTPPPLDFLKGEKGPELLSRVVDSSTGDPVAYARIVGTKLLNNSDQAAAYEKLTQQFTFKEAKQIYGRTDNPTREWLLKCEAAGLIRLTGRGTYEKSGVLSPGDRADTKPDEVAEVTEVSSK